MKNKLLVVLALVAVVAGVLFAMAQHQQKQNQLNAAASQQAAAAQAVVAKQVAVYQDQAEQIGALKVQCETGVAAWKLLTPALQKSQPKPDCALSFR